MTTNITSDSTFNEDIKSSEKLIVVDFWAEWCGPCKQIGPFLDEISNEKKETVNILKLNIDDNPEIPQKFGVRGIPTLMIFKDGKLIDTKVGSMPKNELSNWIESNL